MMWIFYPWPNVTGGYLKKSLRKYNMAEELLRVAYVDAITYRYPNLDGGLAESQTKNVMEYDNLNVP